jgi:uncharacterized protein (TIGR03066 family)
MKRSADGEQRERMHETLREKATASKTNGPQKDSLARITPTNPASSKRRFAAFLLICLLCSAGISYGVFKYIAPSVVAPSIPSELIGAWEVVDGNLKGATLEFTWHGTAIATSYAKNVKEVTTSTVKLEGKRLFMSTEDPKTRKTDTVVQTIINLTDNDLVFRDEDKNTYRMVRIQP